MVMTATVCTGVIEDVCLDLYQCKNYSDFKEHCHVSWFQTVGVALGEKGVMEISTSDDKAEYCNFFTNSLVKGVAQKLSSPSRPVEGRVRIRAVVVPQSAMEVQEASKNPGGGMSNVGEILEAIEKSEIDLSLWTCECLKPTISVVKVVAVGSDDDNKNWDRCVR